MINLSPAAQAVKDAAQELYADRMARKMAWPLDLPVIAAALRAAVDQVVPEPNDTDKALLALAAIRNHCKVRDKFLAIAAELEAQ